MIMGGSHKYKIAPNDYCFAAIVIYLDIINVAIFILKFMGKKLTLKVGNKSVDIVKWLKEQKKSQNVNDLCF